MAKFGKVQQIAVFEDNGLPLFEGKPVGPKPDNKVQFVPSVWDRFINAEAPAQPEKPAAKQDRLF